MTEQPNLSVSKTYSLTMVHIAKVADLAQRLDISQGEVMRRAIDVFYTETTHDSAAPTQIEPAAA